MATNVEYIPDFEVNEKLKDDNYVVYTTTREYSDIYKEYLILDDEEKSKLGVIPNKYFVSEEKI